MLLRLDCMPSSRRVYNNYALASTYGGNCCVTCAMTSKCSHLLQNSSFMNAKYSITMVTAVIIIRCCKTIHWFKACWLLYRPIEAPHAGADPGLERGGVAGLNFACKICGSSEAKGSFSCLRKTKLIHSWLHTTMSECIAIHHFFCRSGF